MNARVGGDGCATLKGGTKGSAPPSLLSPVQTESPLLREPLRSITDRASQTPFRRQVQALTENHRRFIARATVEGAWRSPCKAESCTIWLPGSSCGSSSAVKLVTSWRWERKGKLWHKRPTDLTFSL